MAATTTGVYQSRAAATVPCSRCRRDGFFTRVQYAIRYELELSEVPDFSHSYEHFGRSVLRKPFAKSHFAQPLLMVRRSVYDQLLAAGARDITAESVEVVDANAR